MARNTELLVGVAGSIQAGRLVQPGHRVLVACSGGPDSTALLDALRTLASGLQAELGVVHIDHRQGPDQTGIKKLIDERCRRWRLPFWSLAVDPFRCPEGASENTLREQRYQLFEELLHREGFDRLATGHTASDQAETVLMRVLRGTGTAGLVGIPAIRDDRFIRPMLECTRQQVLDHLRQRRLRWFEDPANLDRSFLRNRVRSELLPSLRSQVNPAVDRALLRLGRAADRDERALRALAEIPRLTQEEPDRIQTAWSGIANLAPAVQARLILRMLRALVGRPHANLQLEHQERVLERIGTSKTTSWNEELESGIRAGRHGEHFYLEVPVIPTAPFSVQVSGPGVVDLPASCGRIRFRVHKHRSPQKPPSGMAFFDAQALRFPLEIRSLQPGDRLEPWGGCGTRKVARLLMDEKVPRHLRSKIPLLVKDDRVLWVIGYRRSAQYPVLPGADRVLTVEQIEPPAPRDLLRPGRPALDDT